MVLGFGSASPLRIVLDDIGIEIERQASRNRFGRSRAAPRPARLISATPFLYNTYSIMQGGKPVFKHQSPLASKIAFVPAEMMSQLVEDRSRALRRRISPLVSRQKSARGRPGRG